MATLKDKLNDANLNQLADMFRALRFGDILRALPVKRYKAVPNNAPADMIAAVDTLQLPDDAKAVRVLRAYARAGSGTLGELVVDAAPMTTATAAGHVNVTESGDVSFADADAWTFVDVEYMPEKLTVLEFTLPASAADTFTIPTAPGIPVRLMAAESMVGGVTGKFAVIAPSDSKPGATKQASFKLVKDKILTKASDAVTTLKFKVGYAPAVDADALLEASPSPYI